MNVEAQVDRKKAPEPGPAPKVELQAAQNFELDNGVKVVVVENRKLPKIDIQLRFDIEPVMEGKLAGYQDMMGELLGSGTRRFTKQQIDEKVDAIGARLNTSKEGIYASCLKQHTKEVMDLIYAIGVSASFPPAEFRKEKTRMEAGVKARNDDPDAISSSVGRVLTYRKGHPYGELTTAESIQRIQRKHVLAYYERFYRPENAYLVFVGDLSADEGLELAKRYFNTWKPAEVNSTFDANGMEMVDGLGEIRYAVKQPKPLRERQVCIVDNPGAAQSVVKVLYPVDLKPNDPRLMAATVMNTILGGGVFNARLMQNLREDKAYTYGAYSSLRSDRKVGAWSGGASVRTEVTREAIGQVIYEMKRMREGLVDEEELELAKNYLAGRFGRSLEDPKTIARFEVSKQLNDLDDDHYRTYLERLDKVTAEDVQQAAIDFINVDQATIFVVGDKEEVGNEIKQFSDRLGVVQYTANGDIYREVTSPPPADVTPESVLKAYVEAIGGQNKIDGVDDVMISMSGTLDEKPITNVTMKSRPDLYKSETRWGDILVQRMVHDGTKAVLVDDIGYPREMDSDVFDIKMSTVLFPESEYRSMDCRLTVSGGVNINGEDAWKLTIQTANGNVIFEYYSVETGLKLKRSEKQHTDNGAVEVITYFKDYRPVDGIKFPHLIKQSAGLNFTMTVDEIKVNEGLGPALFSTE